ncbi:carbonyl reductase [NADPH] 1-like [Diaphorina citri]|uniref:Carbonyl reductase [NADPH] 1-like n=1 Tax=Diaphorina citri TaxID=121845 RepID=A0A3Q0JIR4_DIACI|nr:carbonyl reductase [NADPH] 1-like [Diaphorina citri]
MPPCLTQDIKYNGPLDKILDTAMDTAPGSFGQRAETTLATNFFALVTVCHILFPLLRPHARVVNVASKLGMLYNVPSQELRQTLFNESLTEDQLLDMMTDYVQLAKEGKDKEAGWPEFSYSVSKLGVAKLSFIQHATLSKDKRRPDIIVNPVHPGYVNTDLTEHKGVLTPEQGSLSSLKGALVPPNAKEPRGQFIWYDGSIVDWNAIIPPYSP